jgi:hypothetical protein
VTWSWTGFTRYRRSWLTATCPSVTSAGVMAVPNEELGATAKLRPRWIACSKTPVHRESDGLLSDSVTSEVRMPARLHKRLLSLVIRDGVRR